MPDHPGLEAAHLCVSQAALDLTGFNAKRDAGLVATAASRLVLAMDALIGVVDELAGVIVQVPPPGATLLTKEQAAAAVEQFILGRHPERAAHLGPYRASDFESSPTSTLHTPGAPFNVTLRLTRGPEVLAYANRRDIDADNAIEELVNAALVAGGAPLDTGQQAAGAVVELDRIREAYGRYEEALRARQHGGMAAAHFTDAVYAILHPQGYEPPEPMVVPGGGDEAPVAQDAAWGMDSVTAEEEAVPVAVAEGDGAASAAAYWPEGDLGDDPDGDTQEQT